MSVAVLIDGSFYLRRHRIYYDRKTPPEVAKDLFTMALKHVGYAQSGRNPDRESENTVADLYRIFYYDAPPLGHETRTQHPVTREHITFHKSSEYGFRIEFLKELKKKRKIALRMGRLATLGWRFKKERTVKDICSGKKKHDDLTGSDVEFSLEQKGVDMKIGLDIATIAYKKLASTIVLISGDSDFVPAAKLARREGIDFILDPMRADIADDLFEHIDGLMSFLPSKKNKNHQ